MLQAAPEGRTAGEQPVTESQARSDLVLAFARVLHVNGESTDDTLAAAGKLGAHLGLRARVIPRWGELQLESGEDGHLLFSVGAEPTGVDMDRVASALQIVEQVAGGRMALPAAMQSIEAISRAPPLPTWLFTLAAAAGAAALSVIFGVAHARTVALIAASAGLGAVLRRALARATPNPLLQPLCAARIA